MEELLRETKRARVRAETMGPTGWYPSLLLRSPLPSSSSTSHSLQIPPPSFPSPPALLFPLPPSSAPVFSLGSGEGVGGGWLGGWGRGLSELHISQTEVHFLCVTQAEICSKCIGHIAPFFFFSLPSPRYNPHSGAGASEAKWPFACLDGLMQCTTERQAAGGEKLIKHQRETI